VRRLCVLCNSAVNRLLTNFQPSSAEYTAQQSRNQTTSQTSVERSQYHLAVACGLASSSVGQRRFDCVITDQPTRYREVVLTPLPLRSEKLCQKQDLKNLHAALGFFELDLGIVKMYFCLIILVRLLFSVGSAYECTGPASVVISVKNSTAVFSGEVISEDYRDLNEGSMGEPREAKALVIKLKFKRWWKGNGAEEVDLYSSVRKYPDGTQSFMEEDFRFRKGENYLVYAYGKGEKLRTNGCTRTKKLADAEWIKTLLRIYSLTVQSSSSYLVIP
jgi:hypothetical protein